MDEFPTLQCYLRVLLQRINNADGSVLWLRVDLYELVSGRARRPEFALLLSEFGSPVGAGRWQVHFRIGHINSSFHCNDCHIDAATVPAAFLFGEHSILYSGAGLITAIELREHYDPRMCRLRGVLHGCRVVCAQSDNSCAAALRLGVA